METTMAKFSEKLVELLELAKKKKNVLEYQEINDFFKEIPLDPDMLEKTFDFLEANGVDVLRIDSSATEDLILEVETRTGLTDIGGMDNGYVVHTQGGQMTDMDIIDGGGDIGGQHDLVAYARIVTAKGLASVLEILDIVAMPYTQHGIHLAELNTYLGYICQFFLHSVFG